MKNMKQRLAQRIFILISLFAGTSFGTQAMASEDLAKKNGCLGCHAVSQKIVGPSLTEVALKYKSQPDGVKKLAESIVKGSTGKWGAIAMPAQPQLSPADALSLAGWVLSKH